MTEPNGNYKRVTCKRPHPNQRFHELLESLYQDAVKSASSIVPVLKEALSSLEKYPLPLSSGAECAILKGFDQRLCRYIDLQLNGQPTKNKKTRADDNGLTSEQIDYSLSSVNTDSEMTSNEKTSHTNDKKQENNIENQGMPIIDLTDNETNNNNNLQEEKNLNTETEHLVDEDTELGDLSKYYLNRSRKELVDDCASVELNESMNYVNLALCGNWESLSYEDQFYKQSCKASLKTIHQPIQVSNLSDEETSPKDLITEINLTSDDESLDQPVEQHPKCEHNNEPAYCDQCDPITTAAETFQKYYKEKSKRDAEDIGKCVLPRKMYKPAYRSGAYAILVALLEQRNECPYRDCLTKDELIQKAQKHTDQSFTVPKLDSNYTAWTNAKRLINKGMIQIINYENNTEDFYMLTAMGRAVAMELVKENTPKVTVNDVIFHGQWNDRVPSLEDVVLAPPPPLASIDEEQSSVFIEMPPGTFDIFLLIDKHEKFDKNIPASRNNYCKLEPRSLTVGDFLWVARSRKTGQELVLPYIVERKRMDDLASSIKDGRFHEQKFRLRKCGLKNVIYLVENYRKRAPYALPMGTMVQAVVNTSVLEEFNIVKTDSLTHTLAFLGKLSAKLVHQYLSQYLRGCNRDTNGKELMTFEFFNKFSCKNKPLTVRDTFIKMLLQLKGLSVEKALAITNKYSTPKLLMKAYEKCTEKEGELLLANLKFNNFSRNVGPGVSKTVYQLFSKLDS